MLPLFLALPSFLPVTCECPSRALPLFFRARGMFPVGFASRLQESGGSSTSAFARLYLTQLWRVSLSLAVSRSFGFSYPSTHPLITSPIYSERQLDPRAIAGTCIFACGTCGDQPFRGRFYSPLERTCAATSRRSRIRAAFGSFRLAHGDARRARRAGQPQELWRRAVVMTVWCRTLPWLC